MKSGIDNELLVSVPQTHLSQICESLRHETFDMLYMAVIFFSFFFSFSLGLYEFLFCFVFIMCRLDLSEYGLTEKLGISGLPGIGLF